MGSARYEFHSEWRLRASPAVVFDALRDVERYPRWWPQVRTARPIETPDDTLAGELTCRSLLPYDLVFTARQQLVDPGGLLLRAEFSGDLNGVGEWRLTSSGDETVATFDEDVEVGKPLIRRLGLVARPLLRANHDLMMRGGEAGLRRYLAAAAPSGG